MPNEEQNQPIQEVTESVEQPTEQEVTESVEQPTEQEQQSSLIDVVNASWQSKYTAMQNEYESRISERDKVIKQLITTGKTDNETKGDSIIDKINAQRQYKKW